MTTVPTFYTKMLPSSTPAKTILDYEGVYPCPVCRHGEITALFMTEAFACNFCQHIFTSQPEEALIRVEDNVQPLSWRWNGKNWQAVSHEDLDLTLVIWGGGLALIFLPTALVFFSGLSLGNDPTGNFIAFAWTGLTFITHLTLITWMLAEHYQVSSYVSSKIHVRKWLKQHKR